MFPDPLHPAIVHFPIVLTLLGAFSIILAFFVQNKTLLAVAATLLVLGAISAYYTEKTGDESYNAFKNAFPKVENILDTHADSAVSTVRIANLTAILALLTLFIQKCKIKKLFHMLTIVSAIVLSYKVYETARLGGEMVYGDVLNLSNARVSDTLDKSEHTHEGPDAHSH